MVSKNKKEEEAPVTSLVPVKCLLPTGMETVESLKETLDGLEGIDFPRISFRQGKFFLSKDEDEEGTDEISAVILAWRRQNTYWAQGFDKNNPTPPECYSTDGKTGSVHGECSKCEFNKFGSGQGRGKACRNQIKVWLQIDGMALPMTMFISPTNLSAFDTSFLVDRVIQKGLVFWKVKTKIKAYQKKNETFGRLKFEVEGIFEGEELKRVTEIKEFWKTAISNDQRQDFATEEPASSSATSSAEDENAASAPAKTASTSKPAPSRVVAPKPTPTKAKEESFAPDDDEPPF